MKFGATLRAYAVPEWRAAYVRYGALKALIRRYEAELQSAAKREENEVQQQRPEMLQCLDSRSTSGCPRSHRYLPSGPPEAGSNYATETNSMLLHLLDEEGNATASGRSRSADVLPFPSERPVPRLETGKCSGEIVKGVRRKAVEEFDAALEAEVGKVERHFWERLRAVKDRLRAVREELCLVIPRRRSRANKGMAFERYRSEPSERPAASNSFIVSRSWQDHPYTTEGSPYRSVKSRKLRTISPGARSIRLRKSFSTDSAEHLSEGSEEEDYFGSEGETQVAATAAEAPSAMERARPRRTRPHYPGNNTEEHSGSETSLRATTRTSVATRRQTGCSECWQHQSSTEVSGPEGLQKARSPSVSAARESTGIDILKERGTHFRKGAAVSAQSLRDLSDDSDVETKWNNYGPPLLSGTRGVHSSALVSHQKHEETPEAIQSVCAHSCDLDSLTSNGNSEAPPVEREAHVAHLRRLQRVIISILDTFEKLQGFANLNLICVYKILKKRDKKLGTQYLRQSFSYYEKRLHSLIVPQSLKKTVVSLFRRTCRDIGQEDGIGADGSLHSFHRLQMAVQQDMLNRRVGFCTADDTATEPAYRRRVLGSLANAEIYKRVKLSDIIKNASTVGSRSRPLYFSMGCVCTLFVNVLILATREATNPNYSEEKLIAYLPIYRVVFDCSFATLACALSMACMEAYGVNYKFLLDIDPKSQVDSTTIFGLATLQQLLFFIVFAAFLLDYKFAVFGSHNLYWVYLPALIFLQLLLLVLPHPTFRLTYRKHIVHIIVRVFRAGLLRSSDVTLLQNLVGDVLTSFSKPLSDLEYLICFYTTGVDHAKKPQCVGEGWIRPVLVGIPFYLRLCQCICRYRAGKGDAQTQRLHLLNCGKYISGILVILCNSLPWQSFGVSPYSMCLIWVSSYVCGTIYMFFWDVKVDWGLMPDPDHFLRAAGRSMYSPWMYQSIAVGNLIGRLTWATTLMPMSFSWVVLRLENEHISNSSKYRATLWVPPLYQNSASVLLGERDKSARAKTGPANSLPIQRDFSSAWLWRRDREDMVPSSPSQTSAEAHYDNEGGLPEPSTNVGDEGKTESLAGSR